MELVDQIFVLSKKAVLDFCSRFLPDWMTILISILISITAIAIFAPVVMMYLTWMERKVVGRIQNRYGPNRVGIFGLLQPIADGIKMLTKEDIVPEEADKVTHFLSPVTVVIPVLLIFSVIPFGKGMVAVDLNVGLLFFLALSTLNTIAIFMGAWGSRNKFSLLGGMRTVAQLVSYEVPLVLSVVPVVLVTGSLSTVELVNAQANGNWFVLTPWGIVAFVIFFIAGVAECNRTPFDIPEAESEIIAGFHTEYSGMKFALFYMGEFLSAFAIAALSATFFLGGWHGPVWLPSWAWFLIKTYALIFVMMWLRGTLPRFRVDQLMGFAWKFLLPLTLINMFIAGLYLAFRFPTNWIVSAVAVVVCVALLAGANHKEAPKKRTYFYGT